MNTAELTEAVEGLQAQVINLEQRVAELETAGDRGDRGGYPVNLAEAVSHIANKTGVDMSQFAKKEEKDDAE